MNLQDKKEQCAKDIRALEENLKDINQQIEREREKNMRKKEVDVWMFYAAKDNLRPDFYCLALENPDKDKKRKLPIGYAGRGAFSEDDIKMIIKELQELIGLPAEDEK